MINSGSLMQNNLFSLIAHNRFIDIKLSGSLSATLKLEGLNPAGSIKLKTAISLISGLEKRGLGSNVRIIESSSGNLGIALSMVCANKGYPFTCVIDPNTPQNSQRIMKALGTEVIMVREKDENGGYLNSRINFIKDQLSSDPRYVWTNQYANKSNSHAHYETTASEILTAYPNLEYLFIGSGTTGTLSGCAQYFREVSPQTKIIAVEPLGSITFGGKPSPRKIPGLGTSRVPELASSCSFDELIYIDDATSILMCRRIAKATGLLFGGSTGTVLAAIDEYFSSTPKGNIVSISPDFGDRYLQTIYDDDWVESEFPNLLKTSSRGRKDKCVNAMNAKTKNAVVRSTVV